MKRHVGALVGASALVMAALGQEPRPAEPQTTGRVLWNYETGG
jgi:hypothetical protein